MNKEEKLHEIHQLADMYMDGRLTVEDSFSKIKDLINANQVQNNSQQDERANSNASQSNSNKRDTGNPVGIINAKDGMEENK